MCIRFQDDGGRFVHLNTQSFMHVALGSQSAGGNTRQKPELLFCFQTWDCRIFLLQSVKLKHSADLEKSEAVRHLNNVAGINESRSDIETSWTPTWTPDVCLIHVLHWTTSLLARVHIIFYPYRTKSTDQLQSDGIQPADVQTGSFWLGIINYRM